MAAIDELERVDITVDGVTVSVVGGSFKGIPFFVEDYERGGAGRNVVSKQVPFSSSFIDEDLGGKIPSFPINAFLIGEECKAARDSLIAACNQDGSGELIHPFFGKFQANCISASFKGGKSGINYCTVELEFRPAGSSVDKSLSLDLAGDTKRLAKSIQQNSVSKFSTVFSIVGKGKAALDKAVAITESAMDSIENSRSILATANDFISEIGKIKANAMVLMLAPGDFAARILNLVTATKEMFGITEDSDDVDEYLNMLNSMRGNESSETSAGQIESFTKILAATQVATSLVDASFESVDEALECQDRISKAFDDLLETVDDVDDYMSLSSLQSAALGYLRDVMANMAVVIEKDVDYSCNILQLCYDIYGNVDRVEEIINRNSLIQGFFVLPGKIKVLSK